MTLTRIAGRNFRSFREFTVEPGAFSVIVGPNASGKSNFVQVLRFVRDIGAHGLANAVSMQGGSQYVRNVQLGPSEPLCLELESDAPAAVAIRGTVKGKETILGFRVRNTSYSLELTFNRRGPNYTKTKDAAVVKCDVFELRTTDRGLRDGRKLGTASWAAGILNRHLDIQVPQLPDGVEVRSEDLSPTLLRGYRRRLEPLDTLLSLAPTLLFPLPLGLADIAIYDFDPKLPKHAVAVAGHQTLDEAAGNLAVVLSHLLKVPANRQRLLRLLRDLLPFVASLEVQSLADRSLLSTLREDFTGQHFLPASLMSDGTVNVVALVIALYFQGSGLVVIEEPERNIHASLIAKVVSMIRDASSSRQVVVTTHSPEVLRQAGVHSIYAVARDENGFSFIGRPADNPKVQAMLSDELGVGEVFLESLLVPRNVGS